MRKLSWYLTITISIYLFSICTVYAKDINWMIGSWIPKNKNVLTKLVIKEESGSIWMEAWQPCNKESCFLGKVKATESVRMLQGPVKPIKTEQLSAKFSSKNGTVALKVEEPGKFVHLNIALITSDSTKNIKQVEHYIFQREEDVGKPPCACIFDQNRMFNPEKIAWEGEEWKCAVYKDNGHCERVEKIKSHRTK